METVALLWKFTSNSKSKYSLFSILNILLSFIYNNYFSFSIDYFDEAGSEPLPEATDPEKTKTYIVATYTNKKIKFNGVTFYIDEFPSKLRTMAPSLIMEKSTSASTQADKSEANSVESPDSNYQSTMSDIFYETRSVISTIDSDPIKEIIEERHTESTRESTPEEKTSHPDPILFAKLTGQQELALKLKHSEEVEGPKVEVKILLGSFLIFLTPRQLHTLLELVDALNQPHLEDTRYVMILCFCFYTRKRKTCKYLRPFLHLKQIILKNIKRRLIYVFYSGE